MTQRIGYARVSTLDQNLSLQRDALLQAGCARIFEDRLSGATIRTERPGLTEALNYLRAGDTLVVWRLDRMARSLRELLTIAQQLQERHIDLHSLQEQLDTGTATGRLLFHLFGVLAEFERDLTRERVRAGLQAARARGRKGGRPRALTPDQLKRASELMQNRQLRISEITALLGVSKSTLYKYLHPDGTPRLPHA